MGQKNLSRMERTRIESHSVFQSRNLRTSELPSFAFVTHTCTSAYQLFISVQEVNQFFPIELLLLPIPCELHKYYLGTLTTEQRIRAVARAGTTNA